MIDMKRLTALTAAVPSPGTMSGRRAISHTTSPTVLAWLRMRACDVARLRVLVLELADDRKVAVLIVRPQVLLDPLAVVRDERVRRGEDRLCRAVVLLQANDLGVWKILLEVKDVAYLRAAEPVDRLCVIADHEEVAVLLCEQLQEPVLRAVGVLILVDQHLLELVRVAVAYVGIQLEQ